MAQKGHDPQLIEDVLKAVAEARRANPALPDIANGRQSSVQFVAREDLTRRLGGKHATWKCRMVAIRGAHRDRWDLAMRGVYDPAAAGSPDAPRATLAEHVELHRAQASSADKSARLKEALAKVAALEDEIRDLRWASEATFKPAQWTLPATAHGKGEHIPVLFTSDFQVGEVVDPRQTDHAHGFDAETFKVRYRKLIATTIDLCLVQQSAWRYPGIVYLRGGDAISGGIHEELAETDELTPLEAVRLCFEEEAAGIQHLAEAFGKVEVKGTEEGGNHGRDTHKPRSKGAAAHSYESLIGYMLQREFRNDKRVTFQTSLSPDVYFPVYCKRLLLTHGDKIGSRGGQGFVGPAATILRGAQKVILEQQHIGRAVDEVLVGHFHTAMDMGFAVSNGCLPGYSEYAKLNRLRPEPPSQFLLFYHERFGRVCSKRVFLEEPRPADVLWDAA